MGMALMLKVLWRGLLPVICLSALTGCQLTQSVSTARLIQHQAMVDPTGLKDPEICDVVKVHVATPQKWDALVPKKTAVYTDMQWRSPSRMTGVGVAYIHLPLPIPASAIAWLAEKEYSQRADDGKLLSTWSDALGRPWFEAENSKYHARGCVMVRGNEAWIVYCGYRRDMTPRPDELHLAARSMETVIPIDDSMRERSD